MKIAFIVLTVIHGLIHLMGFLKAFDLAKIEELTLFISKPRGIVWLIGALLFVIAVILFALNNQYWWIAALGGVVVSQVLLVMFWKDARFGTIMNVVILIVSVIALGQWKFDRTVKATVKTILSQGKHSEKIIDEKSLSHLPQPVKNWLKSSGVVGKKEISTVHLKQYSLMKLNPEDKKWKEAYSEQYFTVNPPAFVWKVSVNMMPLISVAGRDLFYKGKGSMIIKILSLFNIVDAEGHKIDTGTMQRFLGEIVWFPTAALSPYITWKEIDKQSAEATMSYNGIVVKGIFYFNEKGEFVSYKARRYMGNDADSTLKDWIITVQKRKVINGISIPVEMKATWKLDKGDWNWLKMKITDVKYDQH